MSKRTILSLASVCLLSACATGARFNDAMEGAVKTTKSAGEVIEAAHKDLIRARAIGAVETILAGLPDELESLTCVPQTGIDATAESLKVFADATELVAEVAKKPDDTTYAGYIARLKASREAAKEAQGGDLLKQKADEVAKALNRCRATFQADTASDAKLGLPKSSGTTDANALAIIGALDKVFKTLLSAIEAAERDAAVKATVTAVIPALKEARERLGKKYDGSYGPVVRFNAAPAEIVEMNRTVLGGAITLERWYVARKINVLWTRLEPCRTTELTKAAVHGQGMRCLADPGVRADVDAFVEAVYAYRGLAPLDSDAMLKKLDKSIAAAEQSTAVKTADLLEGIATVADSLSEMSDAWDKFKKAKE